MRISYTPRSYIYHALQLTEDDINGFNARYGRGVYSFTNILANHFATSAIVEYHADDHLEAYEQCRILAALGKTNGLESEIVEHVIDFEHIKGEDDQHVYVEFVDRINLLEVRWSDPFEAALLQINYWIS